MVMNWLMACTLYPIMLIVFLVYKRMRSSNDRYVFGVTLTQEQKKAERMKEITSSFRKQTWWIFAVLIVAPLTAFLVKHVSLQLTIWLAWSLAGIALMMVPFGIAHERTMSFKQEEEKADDKLEEHSVTTGTCKDETYESRLECPVIEDNDCNWKWGMFYYNKRDRQTLVETRYGIGTTCNLATKGGKASVIIGVLALAWIPIMCGWLILDDFTPIHIRVQEQSVICKHLKVDYTIDLTDIQKVVLLEGAPDSQKNVGTATDTLEKGTFSTKEYGKIYEFLNPTNEKFLYIQTSERTYVIGGYSDEETSEVYEALVQAVR